MKKKLKKISNNKWMAITFFCCLILCLLLDYQAIFKPYIYAEDGSIFINQAYKYGVSSLFITYGGYLVFISRIIALLGLLFGKIFNSFLTTVFVMKWLSIAFAVFVANYFNSDDFDWLISDRKIRLLISLILIAFLMNFDHMYFCSLSLHWWCGLFIFLISINIVNNKLPKTYLIPFIIIAILSLPSVLPIGFALLYYIIKNLKGIFSNIKLSFKNGNLIKIILIGLCLLLESYSILFMTDIETMAKSSFTLNKVYLGMISSMKLLISSFNFIFGADGYAKLSNVSINLIFGAIIWFILLFIYMKNNKTKFFAFGNLYIWFLYFMILYKYDNPSAYENALLSSGHTAFYNAIPAAIAVLMISFALYMIFSKGKYTRYLVTFLIAVLILSFTNIQKTDFSYSKYLEDVEKYVDFNSNKYIAVTISPDRGKWKVNVPVKEDYYNKVSNANENN